MDKVKISIIIPVYNVEKYLEKCIRSVINQTYSNIEILLVDDGSTDKSGVICDDFAKKDRRITVIHKTNGGQGSARNIALDICTGDYISFLDSDDSIKEDYVEYLYDLLKDKNLDISMCNYEIYGQNGELIRNNVDGNGYIEFTGIQAIQSMWYRDIVNIGPWAKLYKKSLWDNVRFAERFSEDFATMHHIFIQTDHIGYSYEKKLEYLVRMNSDIRSFNEKKLEMIEIAEENLNFTNNYEELRLAAINKAISVNFHVLFQLPRDNDYKAIKDSIKLFIKNNRGQALRDPRCRKKTKYALLTTYFGFSLTERIFRIIKKKNPSF